MAAHGRPPRTMAMTRLGGALGLVSLSGCRLVVTFVSWEGSGHLDDDKVGGNTQRTDKRQLTRTIKNTENKNATINFV